MTSGTGGLGAKRPYLWIRVGSQNRAKRLDVPWVARIVHLGDPKKQLGNRGAARDQQFRTTHCWRRGFQDEKQIQKMVQAFYRWEQRGCYLIILFQKLSCWNTILSRVVTSTKVFGTVMPYQSRVTGIPFGIQLPSMAAHSRRRDPGLIPPAAPDPVPALLLLPLRTGLHLRTTSASTQQCTRTAKGCSTPAPTSASLSYPSPPRPPLSTPQPASSRLTPHSTRPTRRHFPHRRRPSGTSPRVCCCIVPRSPPGPPLPTTPCLRRPRATASAERAASPCLRRRRLDQTPGRLEEGAVRVAACIGGPRCCLY